MLLAARTWAGGTAAATAAAARFTTLRATARGVCQTFRSIEFLLAGSKCEILATVAAGKDTVLISLVGGHG
jgi:hypothetical protein